MNADGTNQVRLTTDPGWDLFSTSSPRRAEDRLLLDPRRQLGDLCDGLDGSAPDAADHQLLLRQLPHLLAGLSKIAFDSNRDGNAEIYVDERRRPGQTRLTNAAGLDSYPNWGGAANDTTPPETTIDSGPSGPTSTRPRPSPSTPRIRLELRCSIDTGTPASAPARAPVPPTRPQPAPRRPYTFGCGPPTRPTTPIPPPMLETSRSTPRPPGHPASPPPPRPLRQTRTTRW